jgi:RNA polymerase sigma-70 factor, ECF subfamily
LPALGRSISEAMAPQTPAAASPSAGDDERLLIEAAKIDPLRFADLYERHFDRVYAFVARRAPRRADAEDVTAEVFHRALANVGSFEWRGSPFVAWLLQIARNALADRWQRATWERNELPPETDDGVAADVDRRTMLSELVSRLPEDQQRVVVLRFIEQKSVREAARELQRTEGAVKQLQYRALDTLRACMRDHHE